ncbi:putative bifunctional diguanylate cyclase/phosphodiesterase [Bosea sp. PAMC 26642]|uniref:putative bifunctional diguanylate cyclase/phosphodiesterase n=1 Tax=Bosea sp. (strain PAMC 26642) TaxID=1792307 RepID=UPI0007704C60|nr:EAL domain-containing protein [Bosea sp. PAMC 26642]AMJ63785.1 diguanylate cyclase [Bosea sp. PAMC 26642]
MIAKGETLEATTDRLCREIELLLPNVRCSVLRVDRGGLLHPLAGPTFPDEYSAGFEGLMIGPQVGSCGTAAYLRTAIVVADIATDPRWADYRQHALSLGLRACWSTPILDASGSVLGTFALYFKEQRGPTAREEKIVTSCSSLCAIAMERDQRVTDRERRAFIDALTNLPNRASFDVSLERLSCAEAGAWALLLIDLDNLKTINDTFGHAAGDALLQTVASRIGESVLPDRVFRMGGDEFAVILQGEDALADIKGTTRRIFQALAPSAQCGGHVIQPRATIGGALLSADDDDATTVREHADLALYHAKETGRGGFVLYWPGMGNAITTRIEVIRDVDAALREGRIDAFYQPILRLDTRAIVGLEALCRLRKPSGEIVSAAAFHQATLDVSVASHLTERMMAAVAADIRFWLDQGIPLQHVGINIASADFHSGTLFSRLEAAFGRQNVPLKHIILEVTESVYLGQRDPIVAREIKALRAHGLRVALDDFGTGFASLTHLLTVPIDIIKIDKSFIDRLDEGDPSLAIVQGLVDIARKLDIRVIAEGIENEDQAALLTDIGCVLGQGYLFSPAVPRDVATGLLRRFSQRLPQQDRKIVRVAS